MATEILIPTCIERQNDIMNPTVSYDDATPAQILGFSMSHIVNCLCLPGIYARDETQNMILHMARYITDEYNPSIKRIAELLNFISTLAEIYLSCDDESIKWDIAKRGYDFESEAASLFDLTEIIAPVDLVRNPYKSEEDAAAADKEQRERVNDSRKLNVYLVDYLGYKPTDLLICLPQAPEGYQHEFLEVLDHRKMMDVLFGYLKVWASSLSRPNDEGEPNSFSAFITDFACFAAARSTIGVLYRVDVDGKNIILNNTDIEEFDRLVKLQPVHIESYRKKLMTRRKFGICFNFFRNCCCNQPCCYAHSKNEILHAALTRNDLQGSIVLCEHEKLGYFCQGHDEHRERNEQDRNDRKCNNRKRKYRKLCCRLSTLKCRFYAKGDGTIIRSPIEPSNIIIFKAIVENELATNPDATQKLSTTFYANLFNNPYGLPLLRNVDAAGHHE